MTSTAVVTLKIPQVVLDAAQMNTHDLRRELARILCARQRLSLGQARELAGLTLWEFRQWLGLRRGSKRATTRPTCWMISLPYARSAVWHDGRHVRWLFAPRKAA